MFLAPDWLGSQVDSEARMIEFALSFVSRAKEPRVLRIFAFCDGAEKGPDKTGAD
jgi:hypothetical protein